MSVPAAAAPPAARDSRARRLVRAVAAVPSNTPLRIRLVAAVLLLATLGLTVAGVVGTTALRGYLLERVDAQLHMTARGAVDNLTRGGGGSGPTRRPDDGGPPARPALSSAFFTLTTDAAGKGTPYLRVPSGSNQTGPKLPVLTSAVAAKKDGRPFTVSATGAGHDWRVLVTAIQGSGAVTVATSLQDVDATVGRVVFVNLVVGLVVVALLAVLGYVLIRSSLRQLVQVETTAEAIAQGDLSRRVPNAGPRTEIGRLATAVNTMLATIERAFAAQRASEAQARRSEERMRRFIADAGHELRTPLTSIRGFAELHRQGAVPDLEAVSRVMRRIESEATRMGVLVEDLLLLARLDQQRPLEQVPVDLLAIAADAVHDAPAIAPAHPTRLRVAHGWEAEPPIVLGDDNRLRQVVANLVANAFTHTPDGTPVEVRVETEAGSAVLEVADAGPGLPPDDAARVFERFYRADPSRTRAHGGAGLGLSIVAALVAAHGGRVALRTAPGRGTTFRVTLPLYRLAVTAGEPHPEPGAGPAVEPAAAGGTAGVPSGTAVPGPGGAGSQPTASDVEARLQQRVR